jgi:hypothetical protein
VNLILRVVTIRGTQAGNTTRRVEEERKVEQKVHAGRGAGGIEARNLGKRRKGSIRKGKGRIQSMRGVVRR